jgi:hypothetical protein
MTPTEERCWKYLVANPTAEAGDVALNCDVELGYAQDLIDRIGTPREVLTAPKAPEPERIRLLKRGIELTGGDRNEAYGDPWSNLTACATLWEAYLTAKYGEIHLVAEDVAHMMQLVKMTRTFHGTYHADNYLDSAVYGAMAGECREYEESIG